MQKLIAIHSKSKVAKAITLILKVLQEFTSTLKVYEIPKMLVKQEDKIISCGISISQAKVLAKVNNAL
ncbi:MAG: hypothetical protein ACRAVC_11415 [Trichormus sp.]